MNISAKFKVLTLIGLPELDHRPGETGQAIEAILRAAREATWWSNDGMPRYTILSCLPVGRAGIFGVLAQQHQLERRLYDDEKHETNEDLDSYEDRYFFVDLLQRKAILEWRQFRNRPPLTLSLMQERISRILTSVLSQSLRVEQVLLREIEFETTKNEFIALFYDNRVISIESTDIGTFEVVEDIQLVNPIPPSRGQCGKYWYTTSIAAALTT